MNRKRAQANKVAKFIADQRTAVRVIAISLDGTELLIAQRYLSNGLGPKGLDCEWSEWIQATVPSARRWVCD